MRQDSFWSPRSPDRDDDFLCVHLKHLVYNQPINSVEELTGRVVASSAQIREDREVSSRLRASIARRAQVCITPQGHFQHLL
jgi:hypothetical protein